MKQMSEHTTTANLDAVRRQPNKQRRFNQHNSGKPENHQHNQAQWSHSETEDECTKCGHVHRVPNICPAQRVICRYCHQKGHYARCCFKKRQRTEEQEEVYENEPEEYYYLEEIRIAETSPWLVSLSVMNTEISFKVDSGADVTVMPAYIYESMKQRPMLQPTRAIVQDFSGKIDVQGVFEARVQHRNVSRTVLIYVVRSSNCIPLLSRSDSTAFGILKFNEAVIENVQECDHRYFESAPINFGPEVERNRSCTPSQIRGGYPVKPLDEEMDRISKLSKIYQQNQTQDLGSDSVVADLLSGQSSAINHTDETSFNDVCEISDGTIESLPTSSTRLEESASSTCLEGIRQQQTNSDSALQQVITYTNNSWHECFCKPAEPAKLFYANRELNTTTDGLFLHLGRMINPAYLQHQTLSLLHCDDTRTSNNHASTKPPPLPDGKEEESVRPKAQSSPAKHGR